MNDKNFLPIFQVKARAKKSTQVHDRSRGGRKKDPLRNGTYPFTVPLLAVTARPLSPQSRSLLDWITGPEGQDLLERVGYVPLQQ